jgi:hypothetical protein
MTLKERILIQQALDWIECLPSGLEENPDPNNTRPADTCAFYGGLAHKAMHDALEMDRKARGRKNCPRTPDGKDE